jgi:hypothetical protein
VGGGLFGEIVREVVHDMRLLIDGQLFKLEDVLLEPCTSATFRCGGSITFRCDENNARLAEINLANSISFQLITGVKHISISDVKIVRDETTGRMRLTHALLHL